MLGYYRLGLSNDAHLAENLKGRHKVAFGEKTANERLVGTLLRICGYEMA
jgi:hypothetical protein